MDKTCPIKSIASKAYCTSDCAFYDSEEKECKLVVLFNLAIKEIKDDGDMSDAGF